MTSVVRGRPGESKAVRYTPCKAADQTDEEELEEVSVVQSAPSSEQLDQHKQNFTANGPRVLPSSNSGIYPTPSDRTKLIGERLAGRGSNSTPVSAAAVAAAAAAVRAVDYRQRSRSTSRQSIFEIFSKKIESVTSGRRKSRTFPYRDDVGYVNKAHSVEPMTPRQLRRQRKKDIEDKFGKKSRQDRLETLTTSSSDKDGCKWTFVFDPAGRFAYWWSAVISVAFLYNFWVLIYRFTFEEISVHNMAIWFTLDYTADLLYILDIAFHFRTGFLEDGVLQTDSTRLRIHYMNSTMFYIDCLCLLPLDFLYLSIGYKSMLRCFRLVKIYRFWAFLDRTERHTNYPNVVRTVTLLHYLFAIYHWNACLMFIVTRNLSNDRWENPEDDADVLTKYLHSLYWSTLTLTTIGDLPRPRTKGEHVFVILEFVFGLLLFSTILGHVAMIVSGISASRKDFQGRYSDEYSHFHIDTPFSVQNYINREYFKPLGGKFFRRYPKER